MARQLAEHGFDLLINSENDDIRSAAEVQTHPYHVRRDA